VSTTRTNTRTLRTEDIDVCARLTGDLGAHHMGGHGDRRMAQGALTLSVVPLLADPGVHMRDLSFTFLAPVYEGDTVTATLRATGADAGQAPAGTGQVPDDRALITCEISVVNDAGTPVLTGTGIAEVPRATADDLLNDSTGGGS
jgi:3-hydroxybutyryl-CoA dehydratase